MVEVAATVEAVMVAVAEEDPVAVAEEDVNHQFNYYF
jgi:hypothetical protein